MFGIPASSSWPGHRHPPSPLEDGGVTPKATWGPDHSVVAAEWRPGWLGGSRVGSWVSSAKDVVVGVRMVQWIASYVPWVSYGKAAALKAEVSLCKLI